MLKKIKEEEFNRMKNELENQGVEVTKEYNEHRDECIKNDETPKHYKEYVRDMYIDMIQKSYLDAQYNSKTTEEDNI